MTFKDVLTKWVCKPNKDTTVIAYLMTGKSISGRLVDYGDDWIVLVQGGNANNYIPHHAIESIVWFEDK